MVVTSEMGPKEGHPFKLGSRLDWAGFPLFDFPHQKFMATVKARGSEAPGRVLTCRTVIIFHSAMRAVRVCVCGGDDIAVCVQRSGTWCHQPGGR